MFVLVLASSALAWDSIGAVWPDDTFPLTWYLQGSLPGVSDEDAEAAATAAFETWAAVECAGLTFTPGGRVTDAELGVADGRSVIFLVDAGWPGESSLVSAPYVTADTTTIVDGDVALNGVDYAWVTSGADGRTRMDVQASLTHEIGHMLGLWHSTATDATLNPTLDGNPDAVDLADDDVEGLCALYDLVPGDGTQGSACEVTDDCGADLICLVDGNESYCTAACGAGGECPDGYTCLDADGTDVCALAAEEAGCGCDGSGAGGGSLLAAALAVFAWMGRRGRTV